MVDRSGNPVHKKNDIFRNGMILFKKCDELNTYDVEPSKTSDRRVLRRLDNQALMCESPKYATEKLSRKRKLEVDNPSVEVQDSIVIHALTVCLDN